MKTAFIFLFALVVTSAWAQVYTLVNSKLTYHGTHALKTFSGTSTDGKGKGQCSEGKCEFLVAAPVKSFNSGNSNRDLHMLEEMKGAAHPLITARLKVDQQQLEQDQFAAEADFELAGVKKTLPLKMVKRTLTQQGMRVEFRVPFKLTEFKLERPSLLTLKMDDDVPVDVVMEWAKN